MTIIEEIRNDREKGAKRLESEYKEGLLSFARRFCPDASDAEELVYRTFAEVIESIDGYTERSAFFGWMCKILVNCHAKSVRRLSNSRVIATDRLPDRLDEDGAERVFTAVDSAILRDAVMALPKDMKDAVIMHYFMEMPLKEISKFLSVPCGTLLSRLHYARLALAVRLGAKLKKPAVALIAAAFMLLGAMAAVVGIVSGGPASPVPPENEASGRTAAPEIPAELGVWAAFLPDAPGAAEAAAASAPQISQVTTKGEEETMDTKQKTGATLAMALAALAPVAANGDGYQFIVSGEVVAATTGCSSESSAASALVGGTLADGCVYDDDLEARYRTRADSAAGKLRSDRLKMFMISFK